MLLPRTRDQRPSPSRRVAFTLLGLRRLDRIEGRNCRASRGATITSATFRSSRVARVARCHFWGRGRFPVGPDVGGSSRYVPAPPTLGARALRNRATICAHPHRGLAGPLRRGVGRVGVSAVRDGTSMVLAVRDDGVGIPAEYQEAISDSETFRRVPSGGGVRAGSARDREANRREARWRDMGRESSPGDGSCDIAKLSGAASSQPCPAGSDGARDCPCRSRPRR